MEKFDELPPVEYGYIRFFTDHTGRWYDDVKDRDLWHTVLTYEQFMEKEFLDILAAEIQIEINKEILNEILGKHGEK